METEPLKTTIQAVWNGNAPLDPIAMKGIHKVLTSNAAALKSIHELIKANHNQLISVQSVLEMNTKLFDALVPVTQESEDDEELIDEGDSTDDDGV